MRLVIGIIPKLIETINRFSFYTDKADSGQPDAILTKSADRFGNVNSAYTTSIKELPISKVGKVIGEGKRVKGKNQKSAQKQPVQQRCKFTDSPIGTLASFKDFFATDETGKTADLDYYFSRVLNWRDKSGAIPERVDWQSSARTFMLNDIREGKLVTTIKSTTSNAAAKRNSGQPIIQATVERRGFGTW